MITINTRDSKGEIANYAPSTSADAARMFADAASVFADAIRKIDETCPGDNFVVELIVTRDRKHYLCYCPRGFANEVVYYCVRPSELLEAEAFIEEINGDRLETGGSAEWCKRPVHRLMDWADREWA